MTRKTPLWLQQGSYAASVDRGMPGALWPTPASSGCAVTVSSGMTVNIAAGSVAVPTGNNTGTVLCVSDAVEPVTLAAAPGSGTNRYDLVICQARGNDLDGGANNDFIFTTVTGTAAASPTVPATPANAVALAQIYVPGGSASVTAGNITDVRPGYLAVPGKPVIEAFASVITLAGGTIGGTETFLQSILVPNLAYPYRVRYTMTENYSFSAAGTIDQHVRYNTTGAAAALGDTLHRSARLGTSSTAGGQGGITCAGSIDRPAGGATMVSGWALTSGISVTVAADPTVAQLAVWAVPI